MSCEIIRTPRGATIFLCSRGGKRRAPELCAICGQRRARFLCDFHVPGKRKGQHRTCDRPLCDKCAVETGPNTHQCFVHESQQGELPLYTSHERAALFGDGGNDG